MPTRRRCCAGCAGWPPVAPTVSEAGREVFWLRLKAPGRKVFLIVDHLKVHHANQVKTWVAAHAHEIELFHLPP